MTRETSLQVLGTGALCATPLVTAWIGHPMQMERPLAEVLKAN